MPSQIIRPGPKQNPVMTMITRGRRAYGEKWRKINIYPDPDSGAYLIDNEPAEAPADNTPILVPGLGNISVDMAEFIVGEQLEKAKERAKRPKQSEAEVHAEVNELWHDFVEQKIAWFKGKTTVGPAGLFQREKVIHRGR